MVAGDISKWETPKWHSDFGEPSAELKLLQEFCSRLVGKFPNLRVELDCFEPGYMAVTICRDAETRGELHVVSTQPVPRYGLFLNGNEDEDEFYFEQIDDGIQRVAASLER